jgi:hypothetical protein
MKLTPEQVVEVKAELVSWRETQPCRFLKGGQAMDLLSGDLASKGSNVMYHPVYWNLTADTAKKVAGWTGTKVVFSE